MMVPDMHASMGSVFVMAAPSGAGKSTLVNALRGREPAMALAISHTTRPPRPGEQNGKHYHFVTDEMFKREVAAGVFLEHARVHGHLYGTACTTVQTELDQGRDVLLEIDWQGARQIRLGKTDCVSVFILPPSLDELARRLHHRCGDTPAVIEHRLRNARGEISHASEFDYIIVNDQFDVALTQLQTIVRAARLRSTLQRHHHETLLLQGNMD